MLQQDGTTPGNQAKDEDIKELEHRSSRCKRKIEQLAFRKTLSLGGEALLKNYFQFSPLTFSSEIWIQSPQGERGRGWLGGTH